MKINFISFAIGLSAGIFGGLVGLGGGLIMIPLMVVVLKLTQHKAHGTSLVALVFTGISGAITYALIPPSFRSGEQGASRDQRASTPSRELPHSTRNHRLFIYEILVL